MDKKAKPKYMLPTRHPLQTERHTQTESKGTEGDYSMQTETKIKLG